MKKTVLITIICTVLATLILVLGIAFLIRTIQNGGNWKNHLEGSMSCKGELAGISAQEDGKILSVVDASTGEMKEIWVYEDTVLEGTLGEDSLAVLLDKQIAGAYVSVDTYEALDNIVEGRQLYPAKRVSIIEES